MRGQDLSIAKEFKEMGYGEALESDAAALEWLEKNKRKFGHFINGKFTKPSNTFKTTNPANGKFLAEISKGNLSDIKLAVTSAVAAQKRWSSLNSHERAKYLYALARVIQKNSRLLAVLETLENGKSIRETRDIDVPLVVRHFYHHAGWAEILHEEFKDYEPVGVAGQIIPWNFPLLMLSWKIAPALAAGNSVILKPAETTSLTAIYFAKLCEMIGLPKGVVNIVTGDGETGEHLISQDKIGKIAFTGSTEVGKRIRKKTAGKGKKLTLELGGKSPFIIFDDADIDSAVEGLVDAIWLNQGEVCCAGSRLLVQESVSEKVKRKIVARMKKLRVGNPLDKSVDMGAIINQSQLKKISQMVSESEKEGAKVFQTNIKCDVKGCFYPPTLITDTEPSMEIVREEVFGPVLVFLTFRTPKEAVEIANNTQYGLAASIWTENINLALDMAPKIKAGVIWINSSNMFDAAVGFGGYRESGYGREGGKEGIFEYLKPKGSNSPKKVNLLKESRKVKTLGKTANSSIDQTRKFYIGGKQVRPDGGYSSKLIDKNGNFVTEVGLGNRKDIRDAVESANLSSSWSTTTSHNRSQVMYYLAENLSKRKAEFSEKLELFVEPKDAEIEVNLAIERLFYYAAWTDKLDGAVHQAPIRANTLAINEPLGVIGAISSETEPFLSFITILGMALSQGNRVIIIPSKANPLACLDFYQVIDTSDVPGGVVNIISGSPGELGKVLSEHSGVDAIWHFGSKRFFAEVESLSISNLKQTYVSDGESMDWSNTQSPALKELLRRSVQVKNIWIPYGE